MREQDLGLVCDSGDLQSVCQRVLDSNPDLVRPPQCIQGGAGRISIHTVRRPG